MANVSKVPSGWMYIDESESSGEGSSGRYIYGGYNIPKAPGNGDRLQHRSSRTVSSFTEEYRFYSSITIEGITYSNVWIYYAGTSYGTKTGALSVPNYTSIFSTSYPVVQVRWYSATYTQITSITGTIPAGIKSIYFGNTQLQSITASLPSSLEYINLSGCTSLTTLPTLNTGLKKINLSGCTSLTSVPALPSTVTNLTNAFKGCTNLTGEITINGDITDFTDAFLNTTKPITLLGNSVTLELLITTANNHNVYVGYKAQIQNFTSIRVNGQGQEEEEGEYVLLTIQASANAKSTAQLRLPYLTENGTVISGVRWYKDVTLTQEVTFPTELTSNISLYTIIPVDDTAKGYAVYFTTAYATYTWSSNVQYTTLTGSSFLFDISRDGKNIAFFTSAKDGQTEFILDLGSIAIPIKVRLNGTDMRMCSLPIGACTMLLAGLDPEEEFGGTWQNVGTLFTNNVVWRRLT